MCCRFGRNFEATPSCGAGARVCNHALLTWGAAKAPADRVVLGVFRSRRGIVLEPQTLGIGDVRFDFHRGSRKVDERFLGRGNSNPRATRPVQSRLERDAKSRTGRKHVALI